MKTTTTAHPELVLGASVVTYWSVTSSFCVSGTTQHVSFVFSGSILKHQEDMFAAELHRLKQQTLFSLVDFENLIDRIRSTVAEVSSSGTAPFLALKKEN